MKIDKFKNFELSNKVAELLDKCKTQELRDLISKKYHEYLNSKSKDRKFYIEDCSDLKFDVEIEEDFGEDVMVYYDKQMEDWMLGILEPEYARLIASWNWPSVTLKDGKIVIITYYEEDETIICTIYDLKKMQEGKAAEVWDM